AGRAPGRVGRSQRARLLLQAAQRLVVGQRAGGGDAAPHRRRAGAAVGGAGRSRPHPASRCRRAPAPPPHPLPGARLMTLKPTIRLESPGDRELDEILGGGLPSHSLTVIAGEPGTGKTILTLQTLFHAARRGRNSVYFTSLSEPALKVIRYMQGF